MTIIQKEKVRIKLCAVTGTVPSGGDSKLGHLVHVLCHNGKKRCGVPWPPDTKAAEFMLECDECGVLSEIAQLTIQAAVSDFLGTRDIYYIDGKEWADGVGLAGVKVYYKCQKPY